LQALARGSASASSEAPSSSGWSKISTSRSRFPVQGLDDIGDVIIGKDTGDRDSIVARYDGGKFVHGSLLAVRQDVSHQVTSRRTAVAFDCDCRQAWRGDLSACGFDLECCKPGAT
jgi:hypothetical protein